MAIPAHKDRIRGPYLDVSCAQGFCPYGQIPYMREIGHCQLKCSLEVYARFFRLEAGRFHLCPPRTILKQFACTEYCFSSVPVAKRVVHRVPPSRATAAAAPRFNSAAATSAIPCRTARAPATIANGDSPCSYTGHTHPRRYPRLQSVTVARRR